MDVFYSMLFFIGKFSHIYEDTLTDNNLVGFCVVIFIELIYDMSFPIPREF